MTLFLFKSGVIKLSLHGTKTNDIQGNDTQHNYKNETLIIITFNAYAYAECLNAECCYAECRGTQWK